MAFLECFLLLCLHSVPSFCAFILSLHSVTSVALASPLGQHSMRMTSIKRTQYSFEVYMKCECWSLFESRQICPLIWAVNAAFDSRMQEDINSNLEAARRSLTRGLAFHLTALPSQIKLLLQLTKSITHFNSLLIVLLVVRLTSEEGTALYCLFFGFDSLTHTFLRHFKDWRIFHSLFRQWTWHEWSWRISNVSSCENEESTWVATKCMVIHKEQKDYWLSLRACLMSILTRVTVSCHLSYTSGQTCFFHRLMLLMKSTPTNLQLLKSTIEHACQCCEKTIASRMKQVVYMMCARKKQTVSKCCDDNTKRRSKNGSCSSWATRRFRRDDEARQRKTNKEGQQKGIHKQKQERWDQIIPKLP